MNQIRYLTVFLALLITVVAPSGFALGAGRCEVLFEARSHLDFRTREDLQVTAMKPSLVRSRVIGSIERFVDSLESVRSALDELQVSKSLTRAVLYPMSGFDLTTPLRLFPEAETYVLVDNHSVMPASELRGFVRRKLETAYRDRNGGWVDYKETGGDVFSKLMASLFATLPNAKINSIEFITDSSHNVSVKISVWDRERNQEKSIFYLAGEIGNVLPKVREAALANGGAKRKSKHLESGNWWDEMLSEIAPQALILKGSMSALRQTAYEDLLSGRERILLPLLAGGGVIVEGASRMRPDEDAVWAQRLPPIRDRWELSDGDPRLQNPIREQVLSGIQFSYSGSVRIAIYDPQKNRGTRP